MHPLHKQQESQWAFWNADYGSAPFTLTEHATIFTELGAVIPFFDTRALVGFGVDYMTVLILNPHLSRRWKKVHE